VRLVTNLRRVPEVGSDAWIAAFADAVAGAPVGPADLVVQQELTDTGAAWHVVLDPGGARVVTGRHPEPDVTFSQDATTARAVNRGQLSAQQAFVDGRLRVRGDVGQLSAAAAALAALPAVEG
jgi:putative sterol carrier protein